MGSATVTAGVTVLALLDLISPEWFFGAPALGAGMTGVGFAVGGRPQLAAGGSRATRDAVERFTRFEQLLGAERLIRGELEREENWVVNSLAEGLGPTEFLGREPAIRRLAQLGKRRDLATTNIERLVREHALARADLIVAAQERGVKGPHELGSEELVAEVLRPAAEKFEGR